MLITPKAWSLIDSLQQTAEASRSQPSIFPALERGNDNKTNRATFPELLRANQMRPSSALQEYRNDHLIGNPILPISKEAFSHLFSLTL